MWLELRLCVSEETNRTATLFSIAYGAFYIIIDLDIKNSKRRDMYLIMTTQEKSLSLVRGSFRIVNGQT